MACTCTSTTIAKACLVVIRYSKTENMWNRAGQCDLRQLSTCTLSLTRILSSNRTVVEWDLNSKTTGYICSTRRRSNQLVASFPASLLLGMLLQLRTKLERWKSKRKEPVKLWSWTYHQVCSYASFNFVAILTSSLGIQWERYEIRWVEYVQCGISLFIHVHNMLLWEVKYRRPSLTRPPYPIVCHL